MYISLENLVDTDTVIGIYNSTVEIEENESNQLHIKNKTVIEIGARAAYEMKLQACIENRQQAYKELNQDELRYDDMKNGTNIWEEKVEEIKSKFQKPDFVNHEIIPTGEE